MAKVPLMPWQMTSWRARAGNGVSHANRSFLTNDLVHGQ